MYCGYDLKFVNNKIFSNLDEADSYLDGTSVTLAQICPRVIHSIFGIIMMGTTIWVIGLKRQQKMPDANYKGVSI
jgi:hypothetical protein